MFSDVVPGPREVLEHELTLAKNGPLADDTGSTSRARTWSAHEQVVRREIARIFRSGPRAALRRAMPCSAPGIRNGRALRQLNGSRAPGTASRAGVVFGTWLESATGGVHARSGYGEPRFYGNTS